MPKLILIDMYVSLARLLMSGKLSLVEHRWFTHSCFDSLIVHISLCVCFPAWLLIGDNGKHLNGENSLLVYIRHAVMINISTSTYHSVTLMGSILCDYNFNHKLSV